MILTRRNLFGLVAAPAVIRIAQLMPIKVAPIIEPRGLRSVQGIVCDSPGFWFVANDTLVHAALVDGAVVQRNVIRIGDSWVPI